MHTLSHRRWSSRPLPPYAFVPGRNAHPTADPTGHSRHRAAPPEPHCPPPGSWHGCAAYLYGCDLYNHGYWWEAHEAWESVWLDSRGPVQRRYLQGLIQVANAHLKLEMGRPRAVARLRREYLDHLSPAAALDRYMGNPLSDWLPAVARYHAARLRQPHPEHDPASYPYLHLHAPASMD